MFSEKFICAGYDYTTYTFHVPAPYFRKTFEIDGEVKKSVITLTGLGFYELYVNGQRLTKGILAPYISNPDRVPRAGQKCSRHHARQRNAERAGRSDLGL